MAEAEDVITDAARHTTVFLRDLWRRYQPPPAGPATVRLDDLSHRLDLLLNAVFDKSLTIRLAQPPARPRLLEILFKKRLAPHQRNPVPATDGRHIWLPADSGFTDADQALQCYKVMALQQAIRAERGVPHSLEDCPSPLLAAVYSLVEAMVADAVLVERLPGMAASVDHLRALCLASRPPLEKFPKIRQPLEKWVRQLLSSSCREHLGSHLLSDSPRHSIHQAQVIIDRYELIATGSSESQQGLYPLYRDWWTGELLPPATATETVMVNSTGLDSDGEDEPTRSTRMERRPDIREASDDEDDEEEPGVWMIQGEESHPHAEDPMGLQRPTDRDDQVDANEYGEMVSELPQARLVASAGRPKEVLLSDDPPESSAQMINTDYHQNERSIVYPEWDYRLHAYAGNGARVRLQGSGQGSQTWVDETLDRHGAMLQLIRRRFEVLEAQRVWRRRQIDGDEIDIAAYVESYSDFKAGLSLAEAVYQQRHTADRQLAINLLIDVSGSTDSWVSSHRRIIDVEREALLLVCNALEGLGEPYAVQAFSGYGPDKVSVQDIKTFDEHYNNDIALRISALQPDHYTRVGTAIRHATAGLMQQNASHRLLLVLTDGKPNDCDHYEGRYGVEDTRQAVLEAQMQGISPFCLTIDRQAAAYIPRIFGSHQYAMLPQPESLPMVLLEWMKRLISQ